MNQPDTLVVNVDFQGDFVFRGAPLAIAGAEALILPMAYFLHRLDPARVYARLDTYDTHLRGEFEGSPENLGDPDNGVPGFVLHTELGTPGWRSLVNPLGSHAEIQAYSLHKKVFDMWEQPSREVTVWSTPDKDVDAYGVGHGHERDRFFSDVLPNHVRKAIVVGVAADYCLKYAVRGLVERGFSVEVPRHLTLGIQRQIDQVVAEDFAGMPVKIV